MQLLTYLLFYPLIKLISLQPFCVVYKISDFVNFLLYKVFKYRLKTVRKNLKLVFPDKEEKELREIEKGFYKHFSDITIESIKAYGMNEKQMTERYTYENIDVLKKIQKEIFSNKTCRKNSTAYPPKDVRFGTQNLKVPYVLKKSRYWG